LTPARRVKRYRELALESRRVAQSTPFPEGKAFLLMIADQWEKLAEDTERQTNSSPT
jgi:hypothetical protein